MPDYYELLQVSPNADPEIIQAAYRRLVAKWHPDRNPGDPAAAERVKQLNEAFEVLSDTARRREYDVRRARPASALPAATASASGPNSSPRPTYQHLVTSRVLGGIGLIIILVVAVGNLRSQSKATPAPDTKADELAKNLEDMWVLRPQDVLMVLKSDGQGWLYGTYHNQTGKRVDKLRMWVRTDKWERSYDVEVNAPSGVTRSYLFYIGEANLDIKSFSVWWVLRNGNWESTGGEGAKYPADPAERSSKK